MTADPVLVSRLMLAEWHEPGAPWVSVFREEYRIAESVPDSYSGETSGGVDGLMRFYMETSYAGRIIRSRIGEKTALLAQSGVASVCAALTRRAAGIIEHRKQEGPA